MKNMVSQAKLTFFFLILCLLIALLGYTGLQLLQQNPLFLEALTHQGITLLSSYYLLGLGFALPLIALATIFGWLQFILLMSGNITPHLAKEDFFKVLQTLFKRI